MKIYAALGLQTGYFTPVNSVLIVDYIPRWEVFHSCRER
jgi:hypothetical protein